MNSPVHRAEKRSHVMNVETVVKLIKGVCILILERPEATRMERLIAEKVLGEVEEGFGTRLSAPKRQRRLGRGNVPSITGGER